MTFKCFKKVVLVYNYPELTKTILMVVSQEYLHRIFLLKSGK